MWALVRVPWEVLNEEKKFGRWDKSFDGIGSILNSFSLEH
jgi:hypothetical protein